MKLHRVQVGIQPRYNTRAAPPDNNLELGSRRVAMERSVSAGGRLASSCVAECEGLGGSRGGERCCPAPLSPAQPARAPGLPVAEPASLEPWLERAVTSQWCGSPLGTWTEISHLALRQVFKCPLGCISLSYLCVLPQDHVLVSACTCQSSQVLFLLCLQIHYILNLSVSSCLVQRYFQFGILHVYFSEKSNKSF